MLPPEPAASWRGAGGEPQRSGQHKHAGAEFRDRERRIAISTPINDVAGRYAGTFLRKLVTTNFLQLAGHINN